MPKIVSEQSFDCAEALIQRLGLDDLLNEVRKIVTGFSLLVEERRDANRSTALRTLIGHQFRAAGGWTYEKTGGMDWIKQQPINSRPRYICIGVAIQLSGRGNMLSVDLTHLRKELRQRRIDLAVLVVPSDKLGRLLTGGVARLSEGRGRIERTQAEEMPLVLIAIEHDGVARRPAHLVPRCCVSS